MDVSKSPPPERLKDHKKFILKKQVQDSIRYTFKHDIVSLDGHGHDKKQNQDFATYHQFTCNKTKEVTKIFILGDGHGPLGHEVSNRVVTEYLKRLEEKMKDQEESEMTERNMKKWMEDAACEIQAKIEKEEKDRYYYSGTTLNMVLVRKQFLYMLNIGDSRSFVGTKIGSSIVPSLVSKDHKPNHPEEESRIVKAGGLVKEYEDEDGLSGPPRVWNSKETEPGLATSRTLGDVCGHRLGVWHMPGSQL